MSEIAQLSSVGTLPPAPPVASGRWRRIVPVAVTLAAATALAVANFVVAMGLSLLLMFWFRRNPEGARA